MAPRRVAPVAAAASPTAFPSGLYGKYKQATNFFLHWLLRAQRVGIRGGSSTSSKASKKSKAIKKDDEAVTLAIYEDIVARIAQGPTRLAPSLLQQWTRALAACETAITLRARVALFFPSASQDSDTDSHTHFLERLRSWLETLQRAETPAITMVNAQASDENEALDFSNYYAVLELPDDYFPATKDDEPLFGTVDTSTKVPSVDAKRVSHDSFENDLNVELSFLFMELEELSETVYHTFLDVKREKKTLVEAAAVAKIAIDCAESVIAKLQLRFPSIQTGHDLMVMIQDRIPHGRLLKLFSTVESAWSSRSRPSEPPQSQYVPGTIIADIMWVSRALESFVARPFTPNLNIGIDDGFSGDIYSEERTPQYCAPNMLAMPSFWLQQLPLLYNTLNMNRCKGIKQDTSSFAGWFMDQFDQFFTKRSTSIHLVFIAICWVRSVAALQGNGGLGRTVSLSIMHRWDLEERLKASIARGDVMRSSPHVHKLMEEALCILEELNETNALLRANPVLAGFILIETQLRFVHLSAEGLLSTTRFRAFGHVYHALRDRQLLDTIPFVEEMLRVYERVVFAPSRAASVHGSYTRSYLLSSDMTELAVDAMLHCQPPPPAALGLCTRDVYHLADLSSAFRLLINKDYSVLPKVSATASWRVLLAAVSDLCTEELFASRVLSRDMLKFSDDLTDVFNTLCDTLRRRSDADQMIAIGADARLTHQLVIDHVLEEVVAMPLLPFLDCLDRDGSICADSRADLLQLDSARAVLYALGGANEIEAYCRRAAQVIKTRFAQLKPVDIDAEYYTFPPVPTWSSREFGNVSLHKEPQPGKSTAKFVELMEMMEGRTGPLTRANLEKLKTLIRADPAILDVGALDHSINELCTLLHQAAAGPARDRRLVEWLMQMGALHHQSMHVRHPPPKEVVLSNGMNVNHLFNELAVHSAAKAGLVEMVRLLLEADHMRDLDTVTYHTRESLLHIAVKHGHRKIFDLLHDMGANFLQQDATGKFVYDLTSDAAWKRDIVAIAVVQRREAEKSRARKDGDAELHHKADMAAEKLRKKLAKQREAERASSQASATRASTSTASATAAVNVTAVPASRAGASPPRDVASGSSNTTKSKKKKNAKNTASGDQSTPDISNLVQQLVVGHSDANEPKGGKSADPSDRTETLRRALDVLKEESTASSAERNASAKEAMKILVPLRDSIQALARPSAKHDFIPALRRDVALEASRAVFLLNTFLRQLPEIRRPRADGWKPKPDESTLSPLEQLKRLAGPPFDFDDFLAFALPTAEVLASCGRLPMAKDIMELLERRLLKMKQRPPAFRKSVEIYVMARREMGLVPAEGSTPEARRAFEWYLGNFSGYEDYEALFPIDQLYGFSWYFQLKHIQPSWSQELNRFMDFLDGVGGPHRMELDGVEFLGGYVVAGCESRASLERVRSVVMEMAMQCGLHFDHSKSVLEAQKLTLVRFEFSASGILRV